MTSTLLGEIVFPVVLGLQNVLLNAKTAKKRSLPLGTYTYQINAVFSVIIETTAVEKII